ncbi:MAG: hypothetical protein OXK73_01125, partial [Rhodospirillaceae bacterium]|nr:hypothetical protein [Rhodospirillaceae bacterium]
SIAHKVTGDASYWSKMRVFHEGSGQYALDANTIYPEDRVYFEPSLSSRYMASSLPGYMYSTTKLTAISDIVADQFSYEADYDSVIAGALIAGNQHVIQEMGRTAEVPTGKSVWIPQVVVGWQEIELSDSDPLSIAETVYGNERYELLVATICPSHHVENVGRCILPVLSVPEVTMGYWDVLNDTGVDVQQRFSKIKMHEQTD